MPFDEPIDPHAYRDRGGLDSAVNRPFQTFDGADLHPDLCQKAAALFHSIACNHCFLNGNKRTAVMALDMFLTANERILLMSNLDVYNLAKSTVEANSKLITPESLLQEITERIESESDDFEILLDPEIIEKVPNAPTIHAQLVQERDQIRTHPLNISAHGS